MKLVFKGNYKNDAQLPEGNLPKDAVPFQEPDTPMKVNMAALIGFVPTLILISIILFLSYFFCGQFKFKLCTYFTSIGLILPLLTIIPHELLHAICFGKDAEVELFVSIKNLLAFAVSTKPVAKRRFIFLSIFPNILLGWGPLLLWAILPYHYVYSNMLLPFSILNILCGVMDYLNVYHAIRQMPRGSMQQFSGYHSFWYIPN